MIGNFLSEEELGEDYKCDNC